MRAPRFHALTAIDGSSLMVSDWPLDSGRVRGVVLIVHGLGEHAGRYGHVARRLNRWGFAVRAYDQYGHGASTGARGALPQADRLLTDLTAVVEQLRTQRGPDTPLILLGHSLGGLVVARFVALSLCPVQALVLSSPALDPGLNAVQKLLLATLPRIAPNLRVGNGLNPAFLSHDPAVVAAYRSDPLVHDRICARLAVFIAAGGPATIAAAPAWCVPTLLLYAGADRLVDPAGSRAFARAAPKTVVSAHAFETLYHELFNEREPDREQVFGALERWLDLRF